MHLTRLAPAVLSLCALAACTTIPSGPSAMVLPGSTKNFDQFRVDDANCRQFANTQVNGQSNGGVVADSGVKSAAVGAGVGALAGAAIGGGHGAGTGAGVGLIVGAIAGAGAGDRSSYALQRRYDAAYQQCMYASGHQIPGYARSAYARPAAPQAPQALVPPPPPPPGAALLQAPPAR
jgi:hypothetical protein